MPRIIGQQGLGTHAKVIVQANDGTEFVSTSPFRGLADTVGVNPGVEAYRRARKSAMAKARRYESKH